MGLHSLPWHIVYVLECVQRCNAICFVALIDVYVTSHFPNRVSTFVRALQIPGHPLSKTKQQQLHIQDTESWLKRAVELYLVEQDKPGGQGLCSICKQIEGECFQATQKRITIHKSTLQ